MTVDQQVRSRTWASRTPRIAVSSGFVSVAAIALFALGARLATGPPAVGPDGMMALYWGREIIHGHLPTYPPIPNTPHPLWTTYGALCALLAGPKLPLAAMSLAFYLSGGALIWGGYRLGRATSSPLGGYVTALLLATALGVLLYIGLDDVDVPFAAFVLWALVLEAEKPERGTGVFILLCIAGLLRPEGWILAAAYCLYYAWRRPAGEGRLRSALLAATAPLIWIASDTIVTGSPTFSFHAVTAYAHSRHIAPVRTHLPTLVSQVLRRLTGSVVVAGGIIGAVMALVRRDRRILPVVAVVACGVLAFAATALRGLSTPDRYLLYVAVCLTVLCGYAIAPLSEIRRGWRNWRVIVAVILTAAVIGSLPNRISALSLMRASVAASTSANAGVNALASQKATAELLRSCRTVTGPALAMVPELAWTADLPASSFPATRSPGRSDRTAFVTQTQPSRAWLTAAQIQQRAWLAPAGFRMRVRVGSYALYTFGC